MAVKTKDSGRKFKTRLGKEYALHRVQHLEALGYTQAEIAEKVGVSQPMVCKYVAQLRERYLAKQQEDRSALIAQKWSQLDMVAQEAYDAWDRSKTGEDDDGNVTVKVGDAVFLGKMMDAWKSQRELLGLDAPTKQDVRAAVGVVGVGGAQGTDWAALSGRPPVVDPVEEVAALPEHRGGK